MKQALKIGGCILAEKSARHRTDSAPSMPLMRMREIEKVIRSRYGRHLPDPEDTDDRAFALDFVRAAAFSLSGQEMGQWCQRWAPWARECEIVGIEAGTRRRRYMMAADGVAGLLHVTLAERNALGLKTIGACDVTKDVRKALAKDRKRERDRDAKAEKRKRQGRRKRDAYERDSLSKRTPWKAEGVSRRTWERRRAASVSRIEEEKNGDTLATKAANLVPCPSSPWDDREAGSRGVRGPSPRRRCQEAEPHGTGEAEERAA